MTLSRLFRARAYAELPGWRDDDAIGLAFSAFRRSALHAVTKPYRTGRLGVPAEAFERAFAAARGVTSLTAAQARQFFEEQFLPFEIEPEDGSRGFVTGYYEPIVEASASRTDRFRFPLLARPNDLVEIEEGEHPAGLDGSFAFGRRTEAGLIEYFDRGQIESGALAGRSLELAWLADPVDAFFIHVQGSARLEMQDGSSRRVTYAAKTGHPFTPIGRILAELGEIPLEQVTMQSIRAWFRRNPHRTQEILWQNRSYIFFREAEVDDPALGPVAAAKVPLTPRHSLAVDRILHTFGMPILIDAASLTVDGGPFRKLMIAQDTGSAIVGPARGDLFFGSGPAAGEMAGVVRHPARFFALLPRSLVPA